MNIDTLPSRLRVQTILVLTFVHLWFVAVLVINIVPFLGGQLDLLDFGSFYASGHNLRNGENPYDADVDYMLKIDFPLVGAGGNMINLNPPISAMIFGVVSQFDPYNAYRVWQVISAALFISLITILAAAYRQNISPTLLLWSFTLAGFWQTLILGQIYIVLLLFIALGWVLVHRGCYLLGGLAVGVVVAIKPQFILWPLFLLVAGYPAVFFGALASALLISLIPLAVYGVQIYQQWLEASSLRIATLILPGNSSFAGLTARFGDITTGILLGVILVGILLYILKRRAPVNPECLETVSGLGILVAILASPISWVGYTLSLLPFFLSRKKWTPLMLVGAAILSFPFIFVLKLWQDSPLEFVIFGWFYGWALLILLADLIPNFLPGRTPLSSGSV